MKILHVIPELTKFAGTSTFCGSVCNELVRNGHEVTLVVGRREGNLFLLDHGVKVMAAHEFFEERRESPDVVHIHAIWPPMLHRASEWAKRNKIPVMWSTHGMLAPWSLAHKYWKKFLPWRLYQKRDLLKARFLHATSRQEVAWIQDLGFQQGVVEIPLGTVIPDRMNDGVRGKVILFVGRLHPVKGLENLIRAFAMLNDDAGWVLRLVGPDQMGYQRVLEQLCVDLKVVDRVVFTGPLYGEDLSAEYERASVFVLPSFTENFGGVVIDALAHGVPVIASRGTPWKILDEWKCGWWIDQGVKPLVDALKYVVEMSMDLRIAIGKEGRRLVKENYSWPRICQSLEVAYAKMNESKGNQETL